MFRFIFFVVIVILSRIVIRPFIRNYESSDVCTNASHELKTPLAIIYLSGLQELMTGENEWTKSTVARWHVDHSNQFSGSPISRLEEQPDIVLQDVDFPILLRTQQRTLGTLSFG